MTKRTPRRIYSELLETRREHHWRNTLADQIAALRQELYEAEQLYFVKAAIPKDRYADSDSDEPLARNTDPATSHKAAQRVRGRVEKLNRDILRGLGQRPRQTQEGTAGYIGEPYKTVSPRFCGLRRTGLIHICGKNGRAEFYSLGPGPCPLCDAAYEENPSNPQRPRKEGEAGISPVQDAGGGQGVPGTEHAEGAVSG